MTEEMKGIGIDLIEIDRVRKGFESHGQPFLDRLFTKQEQEYCLSQNDPFPRFAGRFAAKEAIAKALRCGFGEKLSWLDLEILPDRDGAPIVHLSENATNHFGNPKILLSISHSKSDATAIASIS